MHCGRYSKAPLTRREMLERSAGGFGAVALSALLCDAAFSRGPEAHAAGDRGDGRPARHHAPRARNIIFLYMDGGVSQVDTFDPKPRLARDHGRDFPAKIEPTQFDNVGKTLASPWEFRRHGESGIEVSELFPHVARRIDDICVIRSMVSSFSEHTTANYFLHSGTGMQGRPSMGAWISYGLGSDNRELPGYIVINGGLIPSGGLDCFGSGFLPAAHQGTVFRPGPKPIANVEPLEPSAGLQRRKLRLLRRLDARAIERLGATDPLESAIANYELASRMQVAVPALADIEEESTLTKCLYGLDAPYEPTRTFAAECLLARRMVERGVRFVELTCPRTDGNDRWDAHSNLRKNHSENSRAVDQPIAGLLQDLKARGLLDETLVVWAGEFGRTPFAQGSDGRDHSPFGFSIWLAGGGVRGGITHGATDEHGYRVVEDPVEIHDLHATMLHLLGVDHERLTFRFSGRDMRLTDVRGRVVEEVLL